MLILVFGLAIALALVSSEEVSVNIEQGTVVGSTALDKNGDVYYNFWSIPYAKPPVGELRFALPQKAEPWEGVFNATYKRPICPQLVRGIKSGAEDCLYVNVHTRQVKKCLSLKPVIFFIHGGSFFLGNSPDHGAQYLMQADIVLVTVNYRLGPFGSLSSEDDSLGISGNTAMKDQVLALKWVRDNIKHFGGDPKKVTVMGESVGGTSAHLHVLSPASAGLFHAAIAMSGTAEMGFSEGAPYSLEPVGRRLGINSTDKAEILKKLREMSTEEILEAERNYDPNGGIADQFECSVIAERNVPGAFLTKRPMDIIKSGVYNHVPLILGYTNIDGLYGDVVSYQNWGVPRNISNFSLVIPHWIIKKRINVPEAENAIADFYFGKNRDKMNDMESRASYLTGIGFIQGISRVLKAHLKNNKAPIYTYIFSADTRMNYIKRLVPQTANAKGAVHVEDLAYLFKRSAAPSFEKGSIEEKGIDNTVKTFTNIAKKGRPMWPWKPVKKNEKNYMNIGITNVAGVNPDKEAFDFWDAWNDKYFIYN